MDLGELLSCGICHALAEDPVLQQCGHIFCKRCLFAQQGDRSKCPVCFEILRPTQTYPDLFVGRLINAYFQQYYTANGVDLSLAFNSKLRNSFSTTSTDSSPSQQKNVSFSDDSDNVAQDDLTLLCSDELIRQCKNTLTTEFNSYPKENKQGNLQVGFAQSSQDIYNWKFYQFSESSKPVTHSAGEVFCAIPQPDEPITYINGAYTALMTNAEVQYLLISYGFKNTEILSRSSTARRKLLFYANKIINSCDNEQKIDYALRELLWMPFWRTDARSRRM